MPPLDSRVTLLVIKDWLPEPLANVRGDHWRKREKKLKAAQTMVWACAKQEGLTAVTGRARLHITFVFSVVRRRDTDNLYARAKGLIDGLVKGGWLKDDSTDWLDLKVDAATDPGHKATRIRLEPA